MDADLLRDRISRGLGVAARRIGSLTDAFRPAGPSNPIAKANRYLQLSAAFSALDGRFNRANAYGTPLWQGVFDSAYTRVGDYLVQPSGIWFIAAQQPLLPVLCVQANRTVSISRSQEPLRIGVNSYGGAARATAAPLLTGWPASVLAAGSGGKPGAELPADSDAPAWSVLLPITGSLVLRPSDFLSDDLGRQGVVTGAELSALGWRLVVKQVMS